MTDQQLHSSSAVLAYSRMLDLWGMSGKFDATEPCTWLSGTADFRGETIPRTVQSGTLIFDKPHGAPRYWQAAPGATKISRAIDFNPATAAGIPASCTEYMNVALLPLAKVSVAVPTSVACAAGPAGPTA